MADRDTLATLAEALAEAFRPLAQALQMPGALRDLLEDLGWDFDAAPGELSALEAPVLELVALLDAGPVQNAEVPALLSKLQAAFSAVSNLRSASGLAPEFRDEFPRQLIDFLYAEELLGTQARWGYLLTLLGILRIEETTPAAPRVSFRRRELALEDLDDLVSAPLAYVKSRYDWGGSVFRGEQLLQAVYGLLDAWGLKVTSPPLGEANQAQLNAGALSEESGSAVSVRVAFVESLLDPSTLSAGVSLSLLPETASEKPGFALLPYTTAGFEGSFPVSEHLTFELEGDVDYSGGLAVLVRPAREVQVLAGLGSASPSPLAANLGMLLRFSTPAEPTLLFGTREGTRLQCEGVSTQLGTRVHGASGSDVFVECAFERAKLVIRPGASEADSFLRSLLPQNGFELDFDLSVGWSSARGLYFVGSGGLELEIPVHLRAGPVEVLSATLGLRAVDGALVIELAATVKADLGGVVEATLEKIGLRGTLSFPPDRTGNLGPANLALGFKAPTGVGIQVRAGAISGGGFLSVDLAAGRYAGALELSTYGVSVKALGLIDTRVPGDLDAFSFVIAISAEFTPVQLGFGFTLLGVGGVLGIHRRLDSEALSRAVRSGSLEHILFPRDPVRNAPTILRELSSLYPPARDHYAFGPMAKLGWGTPTLIHASLGLVLELPGPRLSLLGVVEMALPTKQTARVSLHMAVAGALDFPKRTFAFDASLYDSEVAGHPLTGDMAFRLSWGERPNFTLAIGGFNPACQAPPHFPPLRRVALDAGMRGNPRLTIQGYFALTSNTAQLGAGLELYASGYGIDLRGNLGFDALFQFSPFSFEASFSASVSVRFHGVGLGVGLHGTLRGPSPFHVEANACVSVLFWDACLPISISFGSGTPVDLPPINPWLGEPAGNVMGLKAAIESPGSWSGSYPRGARSVVTLSGSASHDKAPIDPVGEARLEQKVCPLNLKLSKFGAYRPVGPSNFQLVDVVVGEGSLDVAPLNPQIVRELFAPALFKEMSGAEMLSAPSYQPFDAGFTISPDAVALGDIPSHLVTYDTEIVDQNRLTTTTHADAPLTLRHLLAMLMRSAAAHSGIRQSGLEAFVVTGTPVLLLLGEDGYVVADACALSRAAHITSAPVAHAAAQSALDQQLSARPGDRGKYQVVPSYLVA